jgi:hypothetical protein
MGILLPISRLRHRGVVITSFKGAVILRTGMEMETGMATGMEMEVEMGTGIKMEMEMGMEEAGMETETEMGMGMEEEVEIEGRRARKERMEGV